MNLYMFKIETRPRSASLLGEPAVRTSLKRELTQFVVDGFGFSQISSIFFLTFGFDLLKSGRVEECTALKCRHLSAANLALYN